MIIRAKSIEEKRKYAVEKSRQEILEWQKWLLDRTDPVQRFFAQNQISFHEAIIKDKIPKK